MPGGLLQKAPHLVAKIPNVVWRGGAYHFRRSVPARLQSRLQRRELTCSLRTGDPALARVLSRELYLVSESLFLEVQSNSMLTDEQLARIAQEFYRVVLERENQGRLRGAITEEMRQGRIAHYEGVAKNTTEALACNDLLFATEVTTHILRRLRIQPESRQDWASAQQAVMRAGIDLSQAIVARYRGDFNYEPRDELLKREIASKTWSPFPDEKEPEVVPTRDAGAIFRDAAKGFVEQQRIARRWDEQTAHQARKSYELFLAIAGNKPLQAYGRQDAAQFKDTLERMPASYGKASVFRGMSPQQILTHDATRDQPEKRLTARTVKRHLTALSTLWTDAIARGDAKDNIFSGFKFPRQPLAQEQRQMWDQRDLARLFATPVWSGCQSPHRRAAPGPIVIRDEKFWLPLIAVFSGLRQEEICQLHISDIKREQGIWHFDINDESPRKLKNRTAVRLVPVHSELLRIGFLDHVEEQRRNKQARVFPEFKPGGADGRLGHGFTKWFSRYRKETGIYRPGLDFHSFRHSATTLMHRAGIMDSVIDRLTGHVTPGETSRYTKGSDLNQLKDAIEGISIGVNLDGLRRG